MLRDLPQKRNETDKSRPSITAIEDLVLGFLGQASKGLIDIDVVLFCQFLQQPLYRTPQAVSIFRSKSRNAVQSFADRLPRIGEEQFRIEVPLKTHAAAFCTSALPAIEGEQPRIERLVTDAALETEKALIEDLLAALGDEMNHAVPDPEALIYERFHLAAARFRLADHDVDIMFFKPLQPLGELRRSEVEQFTVNPCPAVSQPSRAGDHFLVETFAPAHDGAQDHHLFTAIRTTDAVEDLTATEGANLSAALDAVLFSDFGIE